MKKILIAVTLLALSSTALASNCKDGERAHDGSLCEAALNAYTTTVDQKAIDAAQNDKINNNAAAIKAETDRAWKEEQTQWAEIQTKYTENAGKALEGQVANNKKEQDDVNVKVQSQLSDKVNTSTFAEAVTAQKSTDSEQNSAIGKEVIDRQNGDKALQTNIDKNKADQEKTDAKQDQAIKGKVDKSTYAVDKAVQGIHDALQDGAIIGLEVSKADKSDLNKETADRIKGDKALDDKINKAVSDQANTDTAQNAAIDSKVDKSTYAVDKAKQAFHDAAQDVAIVGLAVTKADKADLNKEVSARKDADNVLQTNIDSEAQTRATADIALKNNIEQNKAEQANTDAKQDKALSTETDNRIASDNALKANIDKNKAVQAETDSNQNKAIATKASKKDLAKETAARKSADVALSSRIDSNDATLVQHDQRITSNTQRIGSVEGRVSNLEQSTNKRFSDIDKRIGDNRKVASAGIAGAGAMANIPQVTQNGNFSVGAGIGGYDGEQAVAVGFSARVTNSVTTKVSVSTNTQSEVLWGAGVGVEW